MAGNEAIQELGLTPSDSCAFNARIPRAYGGAASKNSLIFRQQP